MKALRRLWPTPTTEAVESDRFDFGFLFNEVGEMPHQNPAVLTARLRLTEVRGAVYAWPEQEPRCVLAFRQVGRTWHSMFPGSPVLCGPDLSGETLGQLLTDIAADLDADALYFPLAYPDGTAASVLAGVPGVATWTRSPSPVINWTDGGVSITSRFRSRHGAQASRKARRWQGMHVASLDGTAACAVLAEIEARSWKANAGLDLAGEGQLAYYQHLLLRGLVTMSAAFCGERAVAYRLDARHRSTVYALEWSYDSTFAQQTPGMFLMAEGLRRRWGTTELDHIDLFGSPDTLKCLVATGVRQRVDFAWPQGRATSRLRDERHAHDTRLAEQLRSGRGIRATYGTGTDPA